MPRVPAWLMLKAVTTVFLCFSLLSSKGVLSSPLKLVTLQYPPYSYQSGQHVKGVAVDIVTEVLNRMEQPFVIELLPWPRAIRRIREGQADAIFTIYKTSERQAFADYSNEVIIGQTISLYARREHDILYDGTLASLKPYSFGAVRAVYYGELFEQAVTAGVILPPDLVDNGENNLRKLLRMRFDILISNRLGAEHILRKMQAQNRVKVLEPTLEEVPSYLAFTKAKALTETRMKFDHYLKAYKREDSYRLAIERVNKSYSQP
ncbi:transporter substrate-binding domain-containing protein [Pseudomaricurvus alkylphenolicus]|uniref:substrate-binding periplasmic protein n=1 Tax=Pseudomaricurvus alkylphenolicus TaxID=1306991 RepID=UPI00142307B9|nr:transporter substrate-binding domain-containing protein [Pseudomaricurvus alkylphenolicus]NIB43633.1 transporter substrate-binding domain-containing protein [Pseudomaricurvus alkylphenolicus]